MLADFDFSDAFIRRIFIINLIPIYESDDIRILFNRSGLSQVAQLRALLVAFFDLAVELREGNDRDIQLFRQALE